MFGLIITACGVGIMCIAAGGIEIIAHREHQREQQREQWVQNNLHEE